jgi:hypothetical protein
MLLLCSCVKPPGTLEPDAPPEKLVTAPPDFGRPVTAEDIIAELDAALEFDAESLFDPPEGDFADKTVLSLRLERPSLVAAKGVSSFHKDKDFLALGYENGDVNVYGGFACRHLTLPEGGPVTKLTGSSGNPLVAATGPGGKTLTVFDLRFCGVVNSQDFQGSVSSLTLSPMGNLTAAVDEARGLWIGPSLGKMERAASLRFESLALAFTPKESLLLAVDEAGWLMFWSPQTGELADSLRLPPGPYKSARLHGRYLYLLHQDGAASAYDIALRTPVERGAPPEIFMLDEGILSYRPEKEQWIRRVFFGSPDLRVYAVSSAGALLVDDVDGNRRCYRQDSGLPCSEEERLEAAGNTIPVDLDSDGRFSFAGRYYALYDIVRRKKDRVLLSRSLADGSFLLWWETRKEDDGPLFDLPDKALPRRKSISADSAVDFVPIQQRGPRLSLE